MKNIFNGYIFNLYFFLSTRVLLKLSTCTCTRVLRTSTRSQHWIDESEESV